MNIWLALSLILAVVAGLMYKIVVLLEKIFVRN